MELTITALSLAVIFLVSVIIIIVTRKQQESDWLTKELVKKTDELSDRTNGLNQVTKELKSLASEQSQIYLYLRSQGIASRHEPDYMHDYPYPRPLLECVKELGEYKKAYTAMVEQDKAMSDFFKGNNFGKIYPRKPDVPQQEGDLKDLPILKKDMDKPKATPQEKDINSAYTDFDSQSQS